jgi:carbonic anhydrase/acetyltransferase-like protein (isoleucine patch superfamily)
MRPEIAPIIAALIGANFLVSPSAVVAQNETPQQRQVARSTAISDQKLDKAAAAVQQVNDVQRDYQQKLESAAPADRPRVANEGNAALAKAVTDPQ